MKEGVTSNSLAAPMMKTEQLESVFIVDVERAFLSEHKENVHFFVSVSTSSPIFPFSRYAQITRVALASLGTPSNFDPLQEFQLHLKGNMEVSAEIKYNGSKTFDGRKRTHTIPCTRGWQGLPKNLEVFSQKASW